MNGIRICDILILTVYYLRYINESTLKLLLRICQ